MIEPRIKRRVMGLVILAVLLVAGPVAAMERYADWLQDQAGNALSGVTVTVRNNADASLATIYASNSITDIKANPFTNGTDGAVVFYAQVGRYNLVFTKANFTFNADDTKDIILGTVLDNSTKAALPTPGTAGRLARVTDDVRGMWIDDGTRWKKVVPAVLTSDFGVAPASTAAVNTAGLQAAIDAANANAEKYKIVWIDVNGSISFNGIVVPIDITLRGNGVFATSLSYAPVTNNAIAITGRNVVLEDFELNSPGFSTGIGIIANQASVLADIDINRFYVSGFKLGMQLKTINSSVRHGRVTGQGKGVVGGIGVDFITPSTQNTLSRVYLVDFETIVQNDGHTLTAIDVTTGPGITHYHAKKQINIISPWAEEIDIATDTVFKTTLSSLSVIGLTKFTRTSASGGSGIGISHLAVSGGLDATGKDSIFFATEQRTRIRAWSDITPQTISTATTTKVSFNRETFDAQTEFSVVDSRFTATKSRGWYHVSATVSWSTNPVDTTLQIYKNGALFSGMTIFTAVPDSITISDVLQLDRDDYVEIFVRQNSGVNKNISHAEAKTWVTINEIL